MHVICFVNLPWSATARLRKVSLQLPHLSVFSLIKRVFRDALKQIYHSDMLNEIPHLPHQEPQTCCAKLAASGNGSEIYPRLIPIETVKTMLFGKNKASQKTLRFDKNDRIMTTSVSAFVRKMSDETFEIFESLFSTASTENCLELR